MKNLLQVTAGATSVVLCALFTEVSFLGCVLLLFVVYALVELVASLSFIKDKNKEPSTYCAHHSETAYLSK